MKLNQPITEAEIFQAAANVHDAITELVLQFEGELPFAKIFLEPDATCADVAAYLRLFGRDHLDELARGLSKDRNLHALLRSYDTIIDLNGGAGHGALLLALLGFGDSVLIIDRASAAGEVAERLAKMLGVSVTYRNADEIVGTHNLPESETVLLLANHAQNVCFALDPREMAQLKLQNFRVIQEVQAQMSPEKIALVSIEPSKGKNGLAELIAPWKDVHFESCSTIGVAKFGRDNPERHKIFATAVGIAASSQEKGGK